MKTFNRSMVYLTPFLLISLIGCSTNVDVVGDPGCAYTQDSYDHVYPRHCDTSVFTSKSKFGGAGARYCNGLPGGQELCDTVQAAPDRRTVQPDGRICYDKNMGHVIGTSGEQWARVVIKPGTGEVVTQFPENSAGCR
ncbi:hypothetical protein [Microbulbifer rhizosphaerae]|uniref:EndoU nuclease n=1 Tax=Microbulbifer rhizosphaerae TaxID=1562603 RepID=A0A7W4Z7I8_9GAMM|nr:hypothetical protein [Microbulbifer rhizosphaerae]MBB3059562.1 hypothetical protein [Microbulbifer rhizosphaerae]